MTIGPEPMTRMRWMSARRGMNQIIYDVIARTARRPARRAVKFGVASHEHRDVHGTRPRGIHSNVGRDANALQDGRRERSDRYALAAAHIVHVAHGSALEQQQVGFDHL